MANLTGAFWDQINLVLCIVGSDSKDLKLYILLTSFYFVKSQQAFLKPHQSIKSQDRMEKTSAMEKNWVTQNLPLQLQVISTETAIFIATK